MAWILCQRFPNSAYLPDLVVACTSDRRHMQFERESQKSHRNCERYRQEEWRRQRWRLTSWNRYTKTSRWTKPNYLSLGRVKLQPIAGHPCHDVLHASRESLTDSVRLTWKGVVVVYLEVISVSMNSKLLLLNQMENVRCVERERERSKDQALWHVAREMTCLRHSTIVLDPLNSGSQVCLNPGQGRADNFEWTRQPTQEDVMIDAVECRTKVEHSKQGDYTVINCPENVGWDLEEGRFGWVTPPICRLVLREQLIQLYMMEELTVDYPFQQLR